MYTESAHIREWIRLGKALLMPVEISSQFGRYLEGLQWIGSGLNWSLLDGIRADLAHSTSLDLSDWFRQTALKVDSHICFFYAPNEPCIACSSDFALNNLDQAFWKAPGKRYLFGASYENGSIRPHFEHFAEYDGADTLMAVR